MQADGNLPGANHLGANGLGLLVLRGLDLDPRSDRPFFERDRLARQRKAAALDHDLEQALAAAETAALTKASDCCISGGACSNVFRASSHLPASESADIAAVYEYAFGATGGGL